MDTIIPPLITPSKRGPYSRHSDEFKRAVVAQSRRSGTSVARVAREHNINANQVFNWRKQFGDVEPGAAAEVCAFVPVALAAPPAAPSPSAGCCGPTQEAWTPSSGGRPG